ncbi:unnamed protein product [Urochloa decumbens]|uniref:RING-type E3 ubiquitin transferase n=1 Tax=Urochloa decumbens TaxID=240449 RepID=A0ABC9DPD6_9POAL
MAHQQTDCHWATELLGAAAIFVAGFATLAVAGARYAKSNSVAIPLLGGGLPAFIFFAIGYRVGSAALRKRRSASNPPQVQGDEEDGTLPGIAAAPANNGPQWRQQHRGCIQLPASAIAQLRELYHDKDVDGGGEECAVCLGKIGGDGLPTRQLPACRHVLHKDCIEQWLRVHPTCPICRSYVPRDSPQVMLRPST